MRIYTQFFSLTMTMVSFSGRNSYPFKFQSFWLPISKDTFCFLERDLVIIIIVLLLSIFFTAAVTVNFSLKSECLKSKNSD